MMKRKIVTFAMALALTGLCCGCSVTNTAGDEKTASGSAVSGTGIKAKEVWEEDVMDSADLEEAGLENSTNYYEDLYNTSSKEGLVQFTKEHKKVKTIPFAKETDDVYYNYHYIDDEKLVYSIDKYDNDSDEDLGTLYCLPLKKGKDGNDVFDLDKKEKIGTFQLEMAYEGVFVNSEMIILFDDDNKYVRYDFKTGKMTEEYPFGKKLNYAALEYTTQDAREIYACVLKKGEETEELWCQDLDTFEWRKLGSGFDDLYIESWIASQGLVVFSDDAADCYNYYCHDLNRDELAAVLSYKKIFKILNDEGLLGKDGYGEFMIDEVGLFISRGRLYVQYETAVIEKKTYQTQYVVLSAALDGSGIQYEKAMTDCMHETGQYKKVKAEQYIWDGEEDLTKDITWRTNSSKVMNIKNGKALFFCDTKEKVQFGTYDLDAGKFDKISKKEAKEFGYDSSALDEMVKSHGYAPDPSYSVESKGEFKYED